MNDEKLHELEARLAILERRDQRRESEHIRLLETRRAVEEELRGEHARDFILLTEASDRRISEIITGVAQKDAEGRVTVDLTLFTSAMLDVVNALFERQQRVEAIFATHIGELAASVKSGSANEKTFTEGFAELGQRVVELENAVFTLDLRGTHAKLAELYERFSAGRAKPPKDPTSN